MGKKEFFKGALLGALIGTAAALLTTKKTGEERRAELKKMSSDLFAKILKEVEKMKVMSKEKYEEVVEKAVVEYGKRKKMAEKQIQEVMAELKSKWSDIQKHMK
ncbi:YtxH domain-containing protein [Candidatus Falkowbacteria bacterium]|nr:YtxH domain-containing protein [Candidatus Falkowbacteria bacterium]